jgi:hypothetical protein
MTDALEGAGQRLLWMLSRYAPTSAWRGSPATRACGTSSVAGPGPRRLRLRLGPGRRRRAAVEGRQAGRDPGGAQHARAVGRAASSTSATCARCCRSTRSAGSRSSSAGSASTSARCSARTSAGRRRAARRSTSFDNDRRTSPATRSTRRRRPGSSRRRTKATFQAHVDLHKQRQAAATRWPAAARAAARRVPPPAAPPAQGSVPAVLRVARFATLNLYLRVPDQEDRWHAAQPSPRSSSRKASARVVELLELLELEARAEGSQDGGEIADNRAAAGHKGQGVQGGFVDQMTRRSAHDALEGHFVTSTARRAACPRRPRSCSTAATATASTPSRPRSTPAASRRRRRDPARRSNARIVVPYDALSPADPNRRS